MATENQVIEFTLSAPGMGAHVSGRLRMVADRWVAEIASPISTHAIGGSARHALVAALEPLGEGQVRRLLADLGLLEPSIAVAEIERAARTG